MLETRPLVVRNTWFIWLVSFNQKTKQTRQTKQQSYVGGSRILGFRGTVSARMTLAE